MGKPNSELTLSEFTKRHQELHDRDPAMVKAIFELINKPAEIFTDEFLEEIGFKREVIDATPNYGKAVKGKFIMEWNSEGASTDSAGNDLAPNTYFSVRADWDTRTVFNGVVYNAEDVRKVLGLVVL